METSPLLTDLYQLTMAYAYWKAGHAKQEAVFQLFFRKPPFGGGYTVACGLEPALEWLQGFRFQEEELAYLGTLTGNDRNPLFEPAFLDYLRELRLDIDLDAVPEGTVVFPHEPLLRVTGPILQGQLLETALLCLLNFNTLRPSKSPRSRDRQDLNGMDRQDAGGRQTTGERNEDPGVRGRSLSRTSPRITR